MGRRYLASLALVWGSLVALGLTLAQQTDKAPGKISIINVTGQKRLVPIAVADFRNLGELPDSRDLGRKLARILRDDLRTSGHFRVIDPKTHLVRPHEEGITQATIRFRRWFDVGAQLLVKVGFIVTGTRLRLEAHFFEVDSARALWKQALVEKGDLDDGRRLTHRIANAIVRYFTGKDGVFTTRIAYSRQMRIRKELAKNLYVVDYDGYRRRALTRNSGLNLFPRFSPDGRQVVFSSTANLRWEITRVAVGSRKKQVLTSFSGIALGAAYSPDGKWILASLSKDGNAEIYLLRPSGRVRRRLTSHWGIDTSPTWSPDGKRIAWISDRAGSPQIYVMNANGSNPRRLTFRGNYNQEPDWNPLGKSLVFTARDERHKFDLFEVEVADGMQVRRLTQDQGNNESGRWSPDGQQIVFTSTRSGAPRLYFMITATRETRRVPRVPGGVSTPAWSPRPN